MLPLAPIALAGGIIMAGAVALKRLRQPTTLIEQLNGMPIIRVPPTALTDGSLTQQVLGQVIARQEEVDDLIGQASHTLALLEAGYQAFVRTSIDPLLYDQAREAHLRELDTVGRQEISTMEQTANRNFLLGVGALGAAFIGNLTLLPLIPVAIGIGLYMTLPMLQLAYRVAMKQRRLSIVHLLAFYTLTMWLGGYYGVGLVAALLFCINRKIIAICEGRARHKLIDIFGQQPRTVWIIKAGVEIEIPLTQLQAGDTLLLDAGQMVPVDGIIRQGAAAIDQHMLTGEAQPVEKGVGDRVLAATVVLAGRIQVNVEKTGAETSAAQMVAILTRTADYRLSLEESAFRLADRSVLPMLAVSALSLPVVGPAGAVALLGANYTVYMVTLGPLTLLNFLNRAARQGILIKDGRVLEELKTIDTIVFDKTGTLTLEQPQVVNVYCFTDVGEDRVLTLAAAAEQRQQHPIAQAILGAASARGLRLPPLDQAAYTVGAGIKVDIGGQLVRVGSQRFLQGEGMPLPENSHSVQAACNAEGHSLVFVAVDDRVVGAIALQATLRPGLQAIIQTLQQQGFALYIISGDHEAPTRTLASTLGIPHYFANTLPNRKAELVATLQQAGKRVCFIGDGINDAIAMRQADVSISLRGATSVATDSAQVVLMEGHLTPLPELLALSQSFACNVKLNFGQSAVWSLVSAGGILFLHFNFALVEALAALTFLTGVGIAGRPLLNRRTPVDHPTGEPLGRTL